MLVSFWDRQRLNHANIIRYVGSMVEDNGDLVLVLELAGAGDLAQLLSACQRQRRLLSEQRLWSFFQQICSAVQVHVQFFILTPKSTRKRIACPS